MCDSSYTDSSLLPSLDSVPRLMEYPVLKMFATVTLVSRVMEAMQNLINI